LSQFFLEVGESSGFRAFKLTYLNFPEWWSGEQHSTYPSGVTSCARVVCMENPENSTYRSGTVIKLERKTTIG
jgi:hypothetical protein